jgi:DNA-binding CsgD family transcriptional regulator
MNPTINDPFTVPDPLLGEAFSVQPPYRLLLDSAGTSDTAELQGAVLITQRTCPEYLLYLQEQGQPKALIVYSGCPETVRQGLKLATLPGPQYIGPPLCSPLTPSERQVLHWLAQGQSNKQIGQRLGKSVHTVKNQIHSVLNKTGFASRYQLIEYYLGRIAVRLEAASD